MKREIEAKYLYRCYEDLVVLYDKIENVYVLFEDVFADMFSIIMKENEEAEYIIHRIMEMYDVDYDTVANDYREFAFQLDSILKMETQMHQANTDADKYDETENYVFDLMTERCVPFTANIEITDRCNLECVHCYRSQESENLWNVENFEKALQQLKALGTLHVVFAGSEPLMHPDILKFIELVGKYGFVLTLQTNATLINDEIVEALKKCTVKMIFVSLYSDDACIHESITKRVGSYKKTISAIKRLKSEGFIVRASVSIFDVNSNQVYAVNNLCKMLDIPAGYNFKIIPAIDSTKDTVSLNTFSADKLYEYITSDKLKLLEGAIKRSKDKEGIIPDRYCATSFRSITVTYDLDVVICNAFRKKCGSFLESDLDDIWGQSDEIRHWREVTSKVNEKCSKCEAFHYCEPCPAHSYTLTGDDEHIDNITCEYGKMFKAVCDRACL